MAGCHCLFPPPPPPHQGPLFPAQKATDSAGWVLVTEPLELTQRLPAHGMGVPVAN